MHFYLLLLCTVSTTLAQWCPPEGGYCGTEELGVVEVCCSGLSCTDKSNQWNWKCEVDSVSPTPTPPTPPTPAPTPYGTGLESVAYVPEWWMWNCVDTPKQGQCFTRMNWGRYTEVLYSFLFLQPPKSEWDTFLSNFNKEMGFLPNVFYNSAVSDGGIRAFDEGVAFSTQIGGSSGLLRYMQQEAVAAGSKFGISIGGWSLSWNFGTVAGTPTQLANFVSSTVKFVREYKVDVIDIDWESPQCRMGVSGINGACVSFMESYVDDDERMYTMFKSLRKGLDDAGLQHVTLNTAAMVTALRAYEKSLPFIDRFMVMSYDMIVGSMTGSQAEHQSPIYNLKNPTHSVHGAVSTLIEMGYPSSKILVGVPLYGRGWVCSGTDISQCTLTGTVNTHNEIGGEPGVTSAHYYTQMIRNVPECHWDDKAKASWCVNSQTKEMWSYDSEQAVRAKARYACEMKLAGAGYWDSMSASDGTDEAQEIVTLIEELAKCKTPARSSFTVKASEHSKTLCGGEGKILPQGDRLEVGQKVQVMVLPPVGCVITAAFLDGEVMETTVNVKSIHTEVEVPDHDVVVEIEYHRLYDSHSRGHSQFRY